MQLNLSLRELNDHELGFQFPDFAQQSGKCFIIPDHTLLNENYKYSHTLCQIYLWYIRLRDCHNWCCQPELELYRQQQLQLTQP